MVHAQYTAVTFRERLAAAQRAADDDLDDDLDDDHRALASRAAFAASPGEQIAQQHGQRRQAPRPASPWTTLFMLALTAAAVATVHAHDPAIWGKVGADIAGAAAPLIERARTLSASLGAATKPDQPKPTETIGATTTPTTTAAPASPQNPQSASISGAQPPLPPGPAAPLTTGSIALPATGSTLPATPSAQPADAALAEPPVKVVALPPISTTEVPYAPPPKAIDRNQIKAEAAGLHPGLSSMLLGRLSDADYANAKKAIETALVETDDNAAHFWPAKRKGDLALYRIHFVTGAAPDCRRYVVTVAKAGWLTTALPMERCGVKRKVAAKAVQPDKLVEQLFQTAN
jgi:hypothetical protein